MINLDHLNNYSFCFPYLYYFFVAKYLAEHIDDNKKEIDHIINNLHQDENAYIAIFISHHSKNEYLLDEIILNAFCLFDKYEPASLSKKEMSFFDKQVDVVVKAALPPPNATPESERAKRLKEEDQLEENICNGNNTIHRDEFNNDLSMELRRSIKTVEVMGLIIKNRSGSLERSRLESIFSEAMRVHLRLLTSFFSLIREEPEQQKIIRFISARLRMVIEDKEKKESQQKSKRLSVEKLKTISTTLFWNMNFLVVYDMFNKMKRSLGSSKLTAIISKVCDDENTPALLPHK
ncbi:MAG: hypothetical protein ABRQ33_02145 [Smithellaceae bacterium]